jgi:hypothetical protein
MIAYAIDRLQNLILYHRLLQPNALCLTKQRPEINVILMLCLSKQDTPQIWGLLLCLGKHSNQFPELHRVVL